MAKISSIEKNNKRKKMVKALNNKRAQLKAMIYDKNLSRDERFMLVTVLARLPRNSAKTRIRNRCELTGRSRGYIRKLGLCRNKARELAAIGQLPGVVKASW